MAFTLPDYNDRPLTKNPYVLWGSGLAALAFIVDRIQSRAVSLDAAKYLPPAAPVAGAANVSLSDVVYTPAQVGSFKAALPPIGQQYAELFVEAAGKEGVSPILLAAIMGQESGYGAGCKDAACRGFYVVKGHGDYGLMQINSKWHPEFFAKTVNGRPAYEDPRASILYGAKVLSSAIDSIQRNTDLTGIDLLFAGVAAYNAGPSNVLKKLRKGQSADAATWGGKYAKQVFDRAEGILNKMNMVVG